MPLGPEHEHGSAQGGAPVWENKRMTGNTEARTPPSQPNQVPLVFHPLQVQYRPLCDGVQCLMFERLFLGRGCSMSCFVDGLCAVIAQPARFCAVLPRLSGSMRLPLLSEEEVPRCVAWAVTLAS